MITTFLPTSEVAYLLRKYLGPLRSWEFTLVDMRRGRADVNGYVLEPSCRLKDDRAWRPYYAGADIRRFIRAVQSICPDAVKNAPPAARKVATDPTDRRPWQARRLAANPVD